MKIATLYKITHTNTGLVYYGTIWAKGKTVEDRLEEHLTGRGSKFIYQLICEGESLSSFTVEELSNGPVDVMCDLESTLAKTSLWPFGLNGNAGKNIVRTCTGQQVVSDAVSKAKKGRTKNNHSGVARQASKVARYKGGDRTIKQQEWDNKKSEYAKANNIKPPALKAGSKKMNNGVKNTFVTPSEIDDYLREGWVFGSCKPRAAMTEETKSKLRKPKQKVTCPHCGLKGGVSQMKRFHYENCENNK